MSAVDRHEARAHRHGEGCFGMPDQRARGVARLGRTMDARRVSLGRQIARRTHATMRNATASVLAGERAALRGSAWDDEIDAMLREGSAND